MKVWIVNPYGNLPGEGWRDYRSTMLAEALERMGHEADWWVSNFEHRSKRFRSESYCERCISTNICIHLVPSTRYKRHISVARIRYEKTFSKNFYKYSERHESPDVIVLADPALFTSKWVVKTAKERNVPLIVDILDLWPELFQMVLPRSCAWVGRLLFRSLYRKRSKLFSSADGIVAASKDYLDVALEVITDAKVELVYLGVDSKTFHRKVSCSHLLQNIRLPDKLQDDIWVVYAGTLGNNYDIDTIIQSANILMMQSPCVKIIIVGDGPLKHKVNSAIDHGLKNVHYLGTLPVDVLTCLYDRCDVALSTYRGLSTVSMPVKAFDYLAAGLPVINSLQRDWGRLVQEEGIGIQYEPENPVSLAIAIQKITCDKKKLYVMSEKAHLLAQQYDSEHQYSKYVNFIEKVVFDNKGRALKDVL